MTVLRISKMEQHFKPINTRRVVYPSKAVMGGTMVKMSMVVRDPIVTNAWKRHRSPKVNPTMPESESHSQA